MRVGLYPGSFNPWHRGHQDVLDKALTVFDKVVVLMCQNPEKPMLSDFSRRYFKLGESISTDKVLVFSHKSTLISFIKEYDKGRNGTKITHMIRGLRDGKDLDYEMAQMYMHEDTGNKLPFVCFLADRNDRHISSSAIRALDKLGLEHGYTTL